MATVAFTSTPTVIADAESITGWTGDTFSLEPTIKIQGTNSVGCAQTLTGNNDAGYSGSWNFTATGLNPQHLRLWANTANAPYLATDAAGGVQIYMGDGTNTAYYYVGGSDTYPGGWKQFVLYTGATPTVGSVNLAAVTLIGIRFNTTFKPKNAINSWFDYWTYGDGYTVTGGTSGDEITLESIAAADLSNAYGVVLKAEGVYFLSGAVQIGDGTSTTYFKDEGDVAVFKDLSVNTGLYDISFVDSATGLTNIFISGGVYSAAGSQLPTFDASDTDLNSFVMTGKQISKFGELSFGAGCSITSNVFASCKQVTPSTSTFTGNTVSTTTDTVGAVLLPSSQTTFKDNNFISNTTGPAIEVPSGFGTTSTSSGDTFTSNTYDYNNLTGATHTVSLVDQSNPSTYTGTLVTFSNSVAIDVHVQDELSADVASAYVYIDTNPTTGDTADIANKITDVNGDITQSSYSGAATTATMRVRKYGYKQNKSQISLTGDTTNTVIMIADPQQT